jgi:hypothetical protein
MITYDTIILVSWVAFLFVWGVSALFVKQDVRGGGYAAAWMRYWLLRLLLRPSSSLSPCASAAAL